MSTKKLYPEALDFSIAGHVESGETYEAALLKEAAEEVRMQLSPTDYTEIGYFWPGRDDVGVYQKVYEIMTDETPNYDTNEFSGYEWLSPQDVLDRAAAGEAIKSDIPKLIRLCYSNM